MGNRHSKIGMNVYKFCLLFKWNNVQSCFQKDCNMYLKNKNITEYYGEIDVSDITNLTTEYTHIFVDEKSYIPYDPPTCAVTSFVYQYLGINEYIIHMIDLYNPISEISVIHNGRILITSYGNCVLCEMHDNLMYWNVLQIYEHGKKQLTDGEIDFIKLFKYTQNFPLNEYILALCEFETAQLINIKKFPYKKFK